MREDKYCKLKILGFSGKMEPFFLDLGFCAKNLQRFSFMKNFIFDKYLMFADICRVYFYQFCAIFTETATQVFRIQSKMCIMLTFGKTGKCYF